MGEMNAKEMIISIVKKFPESLTFHEIIDRLYVKEKTIEERVNKEKIVSIEKQGQRVL